MILSDTNPSVSWRLNDLLKAGKKAKAFATASWRTPENPAPDQGFIQWQPTKLNELPDGARETESLDIAEEVEAEEEAEAAEAVEPVVEEPVEPEPSFDEQQLEAAKREAHAAGHRLGQEEAQAQWQQAKDSFVELTQVLRAAQSDMTEFYTPLKKLALHLAEQLVRGELSISGAAIERLTKEALKDLEQQGEGPIVVRLNPLDVEKFNQHLSGELEGIDLRGDPELTQGSVKVSIDDSAIEDLLEHRLQALSESVLGYAYGAPRQDGDNIDSQFANPVQEKVIEGAVVVEDPDNAQQQQSELDPVMDENTDEMPVDQQHSATDDDSIEPTDSSADTDLNVPDTEPPEDSETDA